MSNNLPFLHPGVRLADQLLQQGKLPEAIVELERYVIEQPNVARHWVNLAIARDIIGRIEEAHVAFDRALRVEPNLDTLMVYGWSCDKAGRLDQAERIYRQVIETSPEDVNAPSFLATVLTDQRRFDEAYAVVEAHAGGFNPSARLHSSMIFTRDLDERTTAAMAQAERRRWWRNNQAEWGFQTSPNIPDPDRKLHIAYVSADFRRHSAATVFAPLLLDYDRERLKVTVLANNPARDEATEAFEKAVDHFALIDQVDDPTLAMSLRNHAVDILVDLSGHTPGHRLELMSMRPAPIGVSMIGNLSGTGVPQIDWLVSDPTITPPEDRPHYAERIWDVPCVMHYRPPDFRLDEGEGQGDWIPPVVPPPMLASGAPTFACANRFSKVSDECAAAWGEIVRAAGDGARLVLKDKTFSMEAMRARTLRRLGLPAERVEFLPHTDRPEHLALFQRVDVCLDPWPSGGGVSTLEALWQGVTVVTLCGPTCHSRVGASMAVHVAPLIRRADTVADYIETALSCVRHPAVLAEQRAASREIISRSPLGDHVAWCRMMEDAYRAMWRQWCARQKAAA